MVDGTVKLYPFQGVTYRVYVHVTNPNDFLSAIFVVAEVQGDCPDLDDNVLEFATSTSFFQSDFGGEFGSQLFDISPSTQYDSFITIGMECSSDEGAVWLAALCPPGLDATALFEGENNQGGNMFIDDGAIFALNGNINGVAGDDLKVLVAQLTTDGAISGTFN